MAIPVYYAVLGLRTDASDEEIRSAYHALAAGYDPAEAVDSRLAVRRQQAVLEAYTVLGDSLRRAAYDAQLSRREVVHEQLPSSSDRLMTIQETPDDVKPAELAPAPVETSRQGRSARGVLSVLLVCGTALLLLGGPAEKLLPVAVRQSAQAYRTSGTAGFHMPVFTSAPLPIVQPHFRAGASVPDQFVFVDAPATPLTTHHSLVATLDPKTSTAANPPIGGHGSLDVSRPAETVAGLPDHLNASEPGNPIAPAGSSGLLSQAPPGYS